MNHQPAPESPAEAKLPGFMNWPAYYAAGRAGIAHETAEIGSLPDADAPLHHKPGMTEIDADGHAQELPTPQLYSQLTEGRVPVVYGREPAREHTADDELGEQMAKAGITFVNPYSSEDIRFFNADTVEDTAVGRQQHYDGPTQPVPAVVAEKYAAESSTAVAKLVAKAVAAREAEADVARQNQQNRRKLVKQLVIFTIRSGFGL